MASKVKKPCSFVSPRRIRHTRLHDDGNLSMHYECFDKLGEGSFGTVHRVRRKDNEQFYAMKTISKKVIDDAETFMSEPSGSS